MRPNDDATPSATSLSVMRRSVRAISSRSPTNSLFGFGFSGILDDLYRRRSKINASFLNGWERRNVSRGAERYRMPPDYFLKLIDLDQLNGRRAVDRVGLDCEAQNV